MHTYSACTWCLLIAYLYCRVTAELSEHIHLSKSIRDNAMILVLHLVQYVLSSYVLSVWRAWCECDLIKCILPRPDTLYCPPVPSQRPMSPSEEAESEGGLLISFCCCWFCGKICRARSHWTPIALVCILWYVCVCTSLCVQEKFPLAQVFISVISQNSAHFDV